MRSAHRIILVVFILLLVVFWLSPRVYSSTGLTWTGVLLATGCTIYLSLAYRRPLGTWPGFGALAALSFLIGLWTK